MLSVSRGWVFTVFSPSSLLEPVSWPFLPSYLVYQLEVYGCPACRITRSSCCTYFVGYVVFDVCLSSVEVKQCLGEAAHVRISVGSVQDNIDYCTAFDRRISFGDFTGPFYYGCIPLLSH